MHSLLEWIDEIKKSDCTIVVEGINDKNALASEGILNIIAISGMPIHKAVESIAEIKKEVIILTDLDKEGKKLYSILRHQLQKHGVKIDTSFREFLFKETPLTHIEGLTQ